MTLVDHPHNLALFVKVDDKDRLHHLIDHMLVRCSKASQEYGFGRRARTFFDPVTRTVYSCFCHIINRLGCSIDESTRRPVTASLLYIRGWGDTGKERNVSSGHNASADRVNGRVPEHTTTTRY